MTTSGTCWSASTSRASTSPRKSSRPASRTPPASTSTSRSRISQFRIQPHRLGSGPTSTLGSGPTSTHACTAPLRHTSAESVPMRHTCASLFELRPTRAPKPPRSAHTWRTCRHFALFPHGGFLWSTFRLLSLHVGGVREPTVSSVPSAACLVVRSRVTCPVHGHGRVRAAGLGASLESSPGWHRRLLLW